MKLLSLFSGIGAFEKALDYLNINYQLVNYCEIDKYASKAYSLIHNVSEDMNLGDITKVDTTKLPKDIDLISYGFPCQDISLAGKQQGMFNDDGSKTRSGLFFEALRIIEDNKPKIAVAEEGDGVYLNRPQQKRGVVQKGMIQTIKCNGNDLGVVVAAAKRGRGEGWKQEIEVSDREVANAITTVSKDSMVALDGLRIRKLTPKECFRLMAFEDEDIDCLIENKISNTQLYKMAGNSIVVDVLKYIFKELFRVINIPLEVLERKDEFMKKTKLTINGYLLDRMFNIEKLVNNEPDLFNELCEKYPGEEGINWIEVGKKGKPIKKVVETPEIKEEPKTEEVSEPVQEVIEEPKQEFPEDFQPLYKVGEKLKIEYLDGKKRESITITSIHLNNDKTLYYYGYTIDETGEHKEMAEDWLVDHEVLQAT